MFLDGKVSFKVRHFIENLHFQLPWSCPIKKQINVWCGAFAYEDADAIIRIFGRRLFALCSSTLSSKVLENSKALLTPVLAKSRLILGMDGAVLLWLGQPAGWRRSYTALESEGCGWLQLINNQPPYTHIHSELGFAHQRTAGCNPFIRALGLNWPPHRHHHPISRIVPSRLTFSNARNARTYLHWQNVHHKKINCQKWFYSCK